MASLAGGARWRVAALAVPPFLSPYAVHTLVLVLFFAYLGTAWNVLGGYAGQFSFGHAAFFGIGAYTSTLLLVRLGVSPWLGLLAGGALAAAFGCFAGIPLVPLRAPRPVLRAGDPRLRGDAAAHRRELDGDRGADGDPHAALEDGRLPLAPPVPREAAVLLRGARARGRGPRARAGHRAVAPGPPAGRDPRERGRRRGLRSRHDVGEARRDGRVGVPDRRRGHLLRAVLHLHRPGPGLRPVGVGRDPPPSDRGRPGDAARPAPRIRRPHAPVRGDAGADPRAPRRRRDGVRRAPGPRDHVPPGRARRRVAPGRAGRGGRGRPERRRGAARGAGADEALRRPPRRLRRRSRRRAGRGLRDHRPERGGEDHALPPHHRVPSADGRGRALRRPLDHRAAAAPGVPPRHRAHVPDRPAVSRPERSRQRGGRRVHAAPRGGRGARGGPRRPRARGPRGPGGSSRRGRSRSRTGGGSSSRGRSRPRRGSSCWTR